MANFLNWRRSSLPSTRNNFGTMHEALDRAVEDFYKSLTPAYLADEWEHLSLSPAIDIVETEDGKCFKLEAEMPGMGPEDIELTVADGTLTIRGQKNTSRQDKGSNYLMREIGYGSYQRSVALPNSADLNNIEASFKKGMLWIKIPKLTEASGENTCRKIKIKEQK